MWRDEILAVGISNFEFFAQKLNEWNRNSTIAVVAPRSVLEQTASEQDRLSLEIIVL
jgi:hypothetical protein